MLRDTFCTQLADRGVAIDVIRELAGHSEIRTTARYAAVHDDWLEGATTDVARRGRGLDEPAT